MSVRKRLQIAVKAIYKRLIVSKASVTGKAYVMTSDVEFAGDAVRLDSFAVLFKKAVRDKM